jgi:hypothetical protein
VQILLVYVFIWREALRILSGQGAAQISEAVLPTFGQSSFPTFLGQVLHL